MRARIADSTDHARWNGYVDRDPNASVYHRWEWSQIFNKVYGKRSVNVLAEDGGRVVGVLPMLCLDRGPFGRQLVSVPYFGHGGAIAESPEAWRALVDTARDAAKQMGAAHVELRHAHPVPGDDLPRRGEKVLMHLALPESADELGKRIGSKGRSDVRRPQKEGMTAEVGGRELIGEFHGAYASVMRDLGSPCHSRALFETIFDKMPERCFVVRVVYQGRTAGAAFLVGQGGVLEVPCAGTLHALNKLRPNMLLYWTVITQAIERGYKTFSFGRSTVDAGTYQFKKNWGAVPVPLPYHYLLGTAADVPRAHGENASMAKASQIWTHLPLPIANAIGPQLVQHLA